MRRAGLEDVDLIVALAMEVQQLHREHDPVTYREPDVALMRPHYRDRLGAEGVVAFLAEAGEGNAIGYVITAERSAAATALTNAARYVELGEIGVAHGHRSRGVGRALHDRVVSHWASEGVTEIRLTVIAFNERARHHYERLGFVETNRRMSLRLR